MQRRTLLSTIAAGLLTASLSLPAFADAMIDSVKAASKIKVGLCTFVPWAFPNKDGQLIAFEVDVANKLAADLGVKLKLLPVAWDAIIPSLVAAKYDVIIGGLTIT